MESRQHNDFDFAIIEHGDDLGSFWVIPMSELIIHGYVRTLTQEGQTGFSLPFEHNKKETYAWTKQYVNNFDQLKIAQQKLEQVEIMEMDILPMAIARAIIKEFNIICPTGAAEPRVEPADNTCE